MTHILAYLKQFPVCEFLNFSCVLTAALSKLKNNRDKMDKMIWPIETFK